MVSSLDHKECHQCKKYLGYYGGVSDMSIEERNKVLTFCDEDCLAHYVIDKSYWLGSPR